jgi:hypothetical protein
MDETGGTEDVERDVDETDSGADVLLLRLDAVVGGKMSVKSGSPKEAGRKKNIRNEYGQKSDDENSRRLTMLPVVVGVVAITSVGVGWSPKKMEKRLSPSSGVSGALAGPSRWARLRRLGG